MNRTIYTGNEGITEAVDDIISRLPTSIGRRIRRKLEPLLEKILKAALMLPDGVVLQTYNADGSPNPTDPIVFSFIGAGFNLAQSYPPHITVTVAAGSIAIEPPLAHAC